MKETKKWEIYTCNKNTNLNNKNRTNERSSNNKRKCKKNENRIPKYDPKWKHHTWFKKEIKLRLMDSIQDLNNTSINFDDFLKIK